MSPRPVPEQYAIDPGEMSDEWRKGYLYGMSECLVAIQDPRHRQLVGGGLGWETARDVVYRLVQQVRAGLR
jgi:hypothetical protein